MTLPLQWRRLSVPVVFFIGQFLFISGMTHGDDHAVPSYKITADSGGAFTYSVKDANDTAILSVDLAGWGPGWKWVYPTPTEDGSKEANASFIFDATKGTKVDVSLQISKPSDNSYAYKYTLNSTDDIPMTGIMASIQVPTGQTGSITFTSDTGEFNEGFPIIRADTVPKIAKAVFHLAGGDIALDILPPCSIALRPTGFRLILAADKLKAGTVATTVTYTLASTAKSTTP